MIETSLVHKILPGYVLSPMGIHGLPHWARVLEIGLRLAERTGADARVVALFAVFHDARRKNDSYDPGHGRRGAELAAHLRDDLGLTDPQFELLAYACTHHTDGRTEGDATVRTCWDSDRLDLWRVGITPRAKLLCTEAARDREMQVWARERSIAEHVPSFVTDLWLGENAKG